MKPAAEHALNALCLASLVLIACTSQAYARPDFLDAMSRQFFGLLTENESQPPSREATPDPFRQMFGSQSQRSQSRPPPPSNTHYVTHHGGPPSRHQRPPNRQGYYAQPQVVHYEKPTVAAPYPPYNGPPPAYGQQHGFGQRQPDSNETKTDGYPNEARKPHYQQHHPHVQHAYPAVEYKAHPHHAQPVEYHHPPETVVEYQHHSPKHHYEAPAEEYHHLPPETVVVEEHQGPTLEIHTAGPGHDVHHHHEPEGHYHHPPQLQFEHHVEPKPKRFQISFNQNPDYKIVDHHLKLPPVKFRFHINPKIVITSNTKDPLDKKHHDDEHDLEPYPPPDVFSDHEAPPSFNKHTIEHYPPSHHYAVEHHESKPHYPPSHHYAVQHHESKPHYPPVEYHEPKHSHYALENNPHDFNYDLSKGHSHLNPHRSSGHYEPLFKVKTKPIIFTEPPPTRPTTTTTIPPPTSSTARTTTTTTTTTARPFRSRARISARNPGFSVAFTQGSSTSTTSVTTPSTTERTTASTTTTRRSIFRSSSERETESDNIARKDDSSSSSTEQSTSVAMSTSTITTSRAPVSTTTTKAPSTTTTTTTTKAPSTTTTTTAPSTTTTMRSTTTTTTTQRPSTTSTATTQRPTAASSFTPAEETTPRTTTLNADSNEIDMRKDREPSRRRPEPLQEESVVKRSETINFESSESVKVIETTMLIDGKNQTVRFYYITQPVKLPLDVFQHMTGQKKENKSGMSVIKI